MIAIVTGTPGTGKTTFARKIAKEMNLRYIDVNNLIRRYDVSCGYDSKRRCKIIDTKKLSLFIIELINRYNSTARSRYSGLVIDSHLSHFLPRRYVDVCYVTKCSLPELKRRLTERGYAEDKIRENLDCEIFDTSRIEALEKGHKVVTILSDSAASAAT